MGRCWTGVRRPVEDIVLRRAERKREVPPEWWRSWNELDGGRWAQEKADEERRIQRLLRVLLSSDDNEDRKARELARALGLMGGDR
jgi:hypothetical protein